ncbi:MAG: GNAT family N-acetyltransferase [bacterium]|jgi:ribosomal protein S18 acetylase RimI-like enzyme|nr:GNAT family N-acetyltransferase [candidate division KSB1 bacterium]MDH7559569.1 GNAT family N-acetyltransferase [bacterium]
MGPPEMLRQETPETFTLTQTQRKPASELLARAFHADPAFVFTIPDPVRRQEVLPWLFERLLTSVLDCGSVLTTPSLAAVALWLGPERPSLPAWTLVRNGLVFLPLVCGFSAFLRFMAVAKGSERLHQRTLGGRHWYLFAMGVEPSHQRHGVGRQLLDSMLLGADAEGLPCYLDTTNRANIGYYERHGFVVAGKEKVAAARGTELTIWAMVRHPRLTCEAPHHSSPVA